MSGAAIRQPAHFYGFDYLRVAGILAVIYIHGCDTNEVARKGMKWLGFAVPCFFMISAFLAQRSVLRKELGYVELIEQKFRRLAPAFFAWSCIYLMVRSVKSFLTGQTIDSGITGILFWGDASYQLYFVPMLFYSFVLWSGLMLLAKNRPAIAVVSLGVAVTVCIANERMIGGLLPIERWFISKNLVWFPIGMLFALLTDCLGEKRAFFLYPSLVVLGTTVYLDFVNVYAISITVFAFAISVSRCPSAWVQSMASCSFGVYLSHVLFIESMQFAAPRLGLDVASLSVSLGITGISAILSFAICLVLGRSQLTRWSVT